MKTKSWLWGLLGGISHYPGAGGALLGRGCARALVLLHQWVDDRGMLWGGGTTALESGVGTDRVQVGAGPGVAAELVHVWVVLGQDGDGVTLLPDDEPGLLLGGAPQVYTIELK